MRYFVGGSGVACEVLWEREAGAEMVEVGRKKPVSSKGGPILSSFSSLFHLASFASGSVMRDLIAGSRQKDGEQYGNKAATRLCQQQQAD